MAAQFIFSNFNLSEKILLALPVSDLFEANTLNTTWRNILARPKFWYNKIKQLGMPENIATKWDAFFKQAPRGHSVMLIKKMLKNFYLPSQNDWEDDFKSPLYMVLVQEDLDWIMEMIKYFTFEDLEDEWKSPLLKKDEERSDSEWLFYKFHVALEFEKPHYIFKKGIDSEQFQVVRRSRSLYKESGTVFKSIQIERNGVEDHLWYME